MTSDFIESNLNNVGLSNDQNENIDEINHFDENFNSDDDNEFLSNDEHIRYDWPLSLSLSFFENES